MVIDSSASSFESILIYNWTSSLGRDRTEFSVGACITPVLIDRSIYFCHSPTFMPLMDFCCLEIQCVIQIAPIRILQTVTSFQFLWITRPVYKLKQRMPPCILPFGPNATESIALRVIVLSVLSCVCKDSSHSIRKCMRKSSTAPSTIASGGIIWKTPFFYKKALTWNTTVLTDSSPQFVAKNQMVASLNII